MTQTSSLLNLPYIEPSQAQKHVTHNESLRILDTLTHLSVITTDQSTPPSTPTNGDRYIVKASGQGAWAGFDGQIAVWDTNAWLFFPPQSGWSAWNEATSKRIVFNGTDWTQEITESETMPRLGINTTADDTNRLSVNADATLLTHSSAGDHRLKMNKSQSTNTASLLFQTNWTGHAEIGTTGSNDLELKVSPDGTTFHSAFTVDHTSGAVQFHNGVSGMSSPEFGAGTTVNTTYLASKGVDLFTNGSCLLGNNYNYPPSFVFDPTTSPNLPGSCYFEGHYSHVVENTEFLAVDPNQLYKISSYLQQQGIPGDWSAYANGARHVQYVGIGSYDVDYNVISPYHHMRFKAGGVDSLTTLTAPLSPGDTTVSMTSAAGWNNTSAPTYLRGIIVFGYKNSLGGTYENYSRIVAFDLFDTAGVNKTTNVVTLKTPLPASMGNPDHPNGTWPVGTALANSSSGSSYKYCVMSNQALPEVDAWYRATGYIGGIAASGTNQPNNFAPGTAYTKLIWLPNFSNIVGGSATYPDTGPSHRVWFAGVSVTPVTTATSQRAADGRVDHKIVSTNFATGAVSLSPIASTLVKI